MEDKKLNTHSIPVTIGITGHRDVREADRDLLYQAVVSALNEIQAACPDSPLCILSSLAEGGDQIAAQAGIDLGFTLKVPLPMEKAEYQQRMEAAGRSQFQQLLEHAAEHFLVPDVEGLLGEEVADGYCYRQAEIYVVSHCHILLALWDGVEILHPEGGGTYEAVDLMLRESWIPQEKQIFRSMRQGAIWQIVTPRKSGLPQGEAAFTRKSIGGNAAEILTEINHLNEDIQRQKEKIQTNYESCVRNIFDGTHEKELPVYLSRLLWLFAAADTISLSNRKKYLRALLALSWLGLLLVLTFLLYDELGSDLMLPLYALCLGAAIGIYILARKKGFHESYIQYRLFAEALRVQFYWECAGVNQNVGDCYNWSQKDIVSWLIEAMRGLDVGRSTKPIEEADHVLKEYWIDRQLAYHKSAMQQKKNRIDTNGRMTGLLMYASVALFIVVFILEFFSKSAVLYVIPTQWLQPVFWLHPEEALTVRGAMKIVLGAVSAAAAFLANYYGKLALSTQWRDNKKMSYLYEKAQEYMEKGMGERGEAEDLYIQLGREALTENADWLIYMLEQSPDIIV